MTTTRYSSSAFVRYTLLIFSFLYCTFFAYAAFVAFVNKSRFVDGAILLFAFTFFSLIFSNLILVFFSRLTLGNDGLTFWGLVDRRVFPIYIATVKAQWGEITKVDWVKIPGYGNIYFFTKKGNFEYGYPFNKKNNEEVMKAILKYAPHLATPTVISRSKLREIYRQEGSEKSPNR